MAKRGTFNGPFFNSFPARVYGTPIKFGILIGSEVEPGHRDIVFAAPTPPQPGELATTEEGPPPPPPPIKDVVAHLKSKAGSGFVHWALEHCSALRKCLPAGLEPCGCFVMASETVAARDLAPLLAPILKDVPDAVVLSIDARKLAFWQYVGGVKPALRTAHVKADAHKDSLLIWSSALIDITVPQSSVEHGADTGARAVALTRDLEIALLDSFAACSIGVSAGTTGLRVVDVSSEAPVSSVASKGCDELCAAFLRGGSALVAAPNPEGRPVVRHRCLASAVLVVLRRDLELRVALGLVRKALAASAAERLQFALERAGEDQRGVVMLPWRAFCRPKEMVLPFWCGDFCTPDETSDAAKERLGQLLGLPGCALDEAPSHLNERATLFKSYSGTYDLAVVAQRSSMVTQGKSKTERPAVHLLACVAALVASLAALTVPLLMRT